jgi:ankyrin repeat protein
MVGLICLLVVLLLRLLGVLQVGAPSAIRSDALAMTRKMPVKRRLEWGAVVAGCLALTAQLAGAGDLRLIEAVKNRNTDEIRRLIKEAVDVNAAYGDGATALHWAAYWDDDQTAALLIAAGAKVDAADDHGVTPLWLACANGASAPVVERLLKAGANADAAHATGETALMSAARTGNRAAVQRLLAAHARVNAREKVRGQSALMWAAAQGHRDIVRDLIGAGAEIAARSDARRQVVNTTGNADYLGVMEVEQGGFTSLLFAARAGHLPVVEELVSAGADPNDRAADATSALVVAAHSGHGEVASFLLDKGADPNAKGSGYAALHIAIRRGDIDLVKALMAHGADPDARLIQATPARRLSDDVSLPRPLVGTTPLWLAASYGELEILRSVGQTANPSLTANDGSTALMASLGRSPNTSLAAGGRNQNFALEAARYLIERGVDVNAADEEGNTALHRAASNGLDPIVQLLVEKGARLEAKNKLGQTPLMLTRPRRGPQGAVERKTTADLLRQLGAKQ